MNCSAAITGLGLVTPLGDTVLQSWSALLAGRFITDHARIIVPDGPPVARVSQLARRVASEAVRQAGWTVGDLASPATALVVGTSKGPVEEWLRFVGDHTPSPGTPGEGGGEGAFERRAGSKILNHPHPIPLPEYRERGPEGVFGLASVADNLAVSLLLGSGPRITLSAACASGLHALIRGTLLLRAGQCERVLVVAAEASVHSLFIGSFDRLGILAPPGFGCRPFDQQRSGFVMSDSAAAVCLERRPASEAIALVDRCAMGADATHITGSDPDAVVLRRLLEEVIAGLPIDLVQAHATGTIVNDVIELNAIETALSLQRAPAALYSHKGALGHSLGAAGLVSIVLNCLSHQRGIVPPNVQTRMPIPTQRVNLNSESTYRPINRSLAIAAGFGGAVAAVSLSSPRSRTD